MTYANSAHPDQTAPEGAVWSESTLFAITLSILKKQLHKKQNLGQNKVAEILGHLPYPCFSVCFPGETFLEK